MGSCFSSSSSSVSHMHESVMKTSKIVCMDGSLMQFSIPTRASTILNNNDSSSFVCNSDRLSYDEYIEALREDEVVVPGKLYFVLPRNMLRKRVSGGEMAALAVKATSALSKTASAVKSEWRRGNKQVMPVPILLEDDYRMVAEKANYVGMASSFRQRDGMKMKKQGRRIGKVQLTVIPEEEE